MRDHRITVTASALIVLVLLAAAVCGQDTRVCGTISLDPEGGCLRFHPFDGGVYQLTDYGGFTWPDTVQVLGHPGDIGDPACLTLTCGMFQYPCFVVSEIGTNPACTTCCKGVRGNLDGDPEELVDISDLTYLVSCVFNIIAPCDIQCLDEWDLDRSGSMDISDLQGLLDYLFFGATLPPC